MPDSPENLSDQVAALAGGEQTACSLAEAALNRAEGRSSLNAFVALDRSRAMTQAEAATQRRRDGMPLSPIDGVPIAVKDNYLTIDYPTTACSRALPLEPDGTDATVVARLRNAGAVIFGKTNMHEWAYGATNSTSSIGPTRNPHNEDHITGGSSGGSGAAVAAGIVAAALGSDTGGSVRIPSAACGLYGFKPSYGRASRHGVLPLSWSLDAPGPMARSLDDILLLLPYFFGTDPLDPSTANAAPLKQLPDVARPKLISLVGEGLERSQEIGAAIDRTLSSLDVDVTHFEMRDVASFFSAWEAILHCEASAYHAAQLRRNPCLFTDVTRAHLEAGLQISGVELLKAQQIRASFLALLLNELPEWDALVLPTLPVTVPRAGDDWQEFVGRRVSTQDSMTWFCWPGNLAGLPCITLPLSSSHSRNGLPIGIMLMGKPGEDERLLSIAQWFENNVRKNEST